MNYFFLLSSDSCSKSLISFSTKLIFPSPSYKYFTFHKHIYIFLDFALVIPKTLFF